MLARRQRGARPPPRHLVARRRLAAAPTSPLLRPSPVFFRAGHDVFGKAKTGSGKTLAFLLPIVEMLRAENAALAAARRPPASGVRALIIAPTRELALQILQEAKILLTHDASFKAEAVIGGRPIGGEKGRMGFGAGGRARVDILVATPGRLIDHLESTAGFPEALREARKLVLDEADRMLDMGFKPALDRIVAALPAAGGAGSGSGGRQTLLFSATVPREVLTIAERVLQRGYKFEDCVGEDEVDTNAQVPQEFLVVPAASVLPALARVLAHAVRADPAAYKVIVFFPTARQTGYFATLLGPAAAGGVGHNIVEIHSRKSQSARIAAADRFKRERGIIMFSSDVAARGMDFPDVTHVIQVGLTDREQYVHRLGRTARAGKRGAGLLLLADFEAEVMLRDLRDLPLQPAGAGSALTGGASAGVPAMRSAGATTEPVPAPADLAAAVRAVAGRPDLRKECEQAYGAFLGFYNSNLRRLHWTQARLVDEANRLFLTLGCNEVPIMPKDTLGCEGRGPGGRVARARFGATRPRPQHPPLPRNARPSRAQKNGPPGCPWNTRR